MAYNPVSLDTLCAALAEVMGIPAPAQAQPANEALTAFAADAFGGQKADRIFMYNPDANAQWVYEKYPDFSKEMTERTQLSLPFCTVMPSVTPVCFGTMYTGTQPEVHGIRKYEKPVIRTDSIFDALLRAGKKCAIVAETNCSMSKIYLEREMDYFIYDSIAEVNAKAVELILKDEYDFISVYNGDYDATMHGHGPEHPLSLAAFKANAAAYALFYELISANWKKHNTLLGFAMDHGCHEIDGGFGSHGLDMEEDLNIVHRYAAIPAKV